jgi:CubicO group peptidase (beta-lactamase class C family)
MQVSVMQRGTLIYSKAFGSANLETGTRLTPASVMRIASVTKQFTAAALLLLQEEGRLSVDDRLSRFVPELAVAEQVTLRQMLSHVSGLAIAPAADAIVRRGTEVTEHDAASMLAVIKGRKPFLRTPPGSKWEYNNLAYRLLGIVAERASGKPLRDLFKARLIDPAGLGRTAVDDPALIIPGRASGYELAAGAPTGFRNASPYSLSWTGASGAMISTTDDLCRWHAHLLEARLLRPESLATMLAPVRLTDGSLPARPPGADPSGSTDPLRYGFGIRTENRNGRRMITHIGSIAGFSADLTSFPDQRTSIAVLINSGPTEGDNRNSRMIYAAVQEAARIALG